MVLTLSILNVYLNCYTFYGYKLLRVEESLINLIHINYRYQTSLIRQEILKYFLIQSGQEYGQKSN